MQAKKTETVRKKKTLSYYHLISMILLSVCFIIYAAVIAICFARHYFTKSDPVVAICAGIVFVLFGAAVIIVNCQYKRSIELHDCLNNLRNVSDSIAKLDYNVTKIQTDPESNINELYERVKYALEELKKNYDELHNTTQQLEDTLKNREQLETAHHEFIANASHEMKTPLGLLMLYAEGLKNNLDGIDKDYYCNVIIEVVQNLDKKVKRLMSMSLVESGLAPMNMECFDYSELFRCITDRLSVMLVGFDVTVEYDKDVYVYGDIYYLGEVIKNFITNAVAYTEKGQKIQIKLNRTKKHAELSVFNGGAHIETELMTKLWDSFYKCKNECCCKDDDSHIGMGLCLIRLVMEQHNGLYGVENLSDGVRFYTKLVLI